MNSRCVRIALSNIQELENKKKQLERREKQNAK